MLEEAECESIGGGDCWTVGNDCEDERSDYVQCIRDASEIEYVDIHDGTGLVFGEEIEPSSVTSAVTPEWELEGDTIYVMEVHSPIGGFF